jgi:hypothetical protein
MKTHLLFIGGTKTDLGEFLDALLSVPEEDGFKCTYAVTVSLALEMLKYLVPDHILLNDINTEEECRHFMSVIADRPGLDSVKIHLYGGDESVAGNLQIPGCIRKCESVEALSIQLTSVFAQEQNADSLMGNTQNN